MSLRRSGDDDLLSPYVGARPFDERDASRFFGRRRETRELLSLIRSRQVVLVYSPSGAGKSSLLEAAVRPQLRADGWDVLPKVRVQPSGVDDRFEGHPNRYTAAVLSSLCPPDATSPPSSLSSYFAAHGEATDEFGDPVRTLLVIDQFEEITQPYHSDATTWLEAQEGFIEDLATAIEATPALRVVLAIREDNLGEVEDLGRRLPNGLRTRYRLGRLQAASALEAVREPAELAGRPFAQGVAASLVERLARRSVDVGGERADVPGSWIDPTQLQVVCRQLWAMSDGADEITAEHVEDLGGVDGALIAYYEDGLHDVGSPLRQARLRRFFGNRLITPAGTRQLVYYAPESRSTGGVANSTLERLEQRSLVRRERRGGASFWELSHDGFVEPIRESNRRFATRWRSIVVGAASLLVVVGGVLFASLASDGDAEAEALRAEVRQLEDLTVVVEELEDVIGLPRNDALERLDVDLTVSDVVAVCSSDDVAAELAVEVLDVGGAEPTVLIDAGGAQVPNVARERAVELRVSTGQACGENVVVPQVVEKSLEEARGLLVQSGFAVEQVSACGEADVVIDLQRATTGESVEEGTEIEVSTPLQLVVGDGTPCKLLAVVPDFGGLPTEEAVEQLEAAGFVVVEVVRAIDLRDGDADGDGCGSTNAPVVRRVVPADDGDVGVFTGNDSTAAANLVPGAREDVPADVAVVEAVECIGVPRDLYEADNTEVIVRMEEELGFTVTQVIPVCSVLTESGLVRQVFSTDLGDPVVTGTLDGVIVGNPDSLAPGPLLDPDLGEMLVPSLDVVVKVSTGEQCLIELPLDLLGETVGTLEERYRTSITVDPRPDDLDCGADDPVVARIESDDGEVLLSDETEEAATVLQLSTVTVEQRCP